MSSTQDYLKKYMSKPASLEEHKRKKLKKKKSSSTKTTVKKGNFAIHDEDEVSWKNTRSESDSDDMPVIEAPKAPAYKSSSSSWATIREGEPSREEILQRNVVPEWDDVENEDERPAIAGLVVENEALSRPSKKPAKKTWKATSKTARDTSLSPPPRPVQRLPSSRSPSPRGRSPIRGRHSRSPSKSRSPARRKYSPSRSRSPAQQKRNRSPSRSPSPYSKRRELSPRSSRTRSRSGSVELMSSGAKAGLQTAEQVKRDTDRRQQEYLDRMRALDPSKSGRDAETVYRDAQGRKVDRVAEKIEAAAAKRREIEKQERQMEWGKGLVQREEEQARKKRMEEEKFKPLARYKDDEELNEELKDRDRWNDPAAMFLTGVKKSKKAAPKFPLYQGNFPPNRYNIRPGYRWDGVDRSNGFEKDYFMELLDRLSKEFPPATFDATEKHRLEVLESNIEKLQQKLQQSQVDRLQLMGELKDAADRNADFKRWFQKLTSKHTDLESRLHEATDRKWA
ncbi:hypothetical protein BGZ59_005002 [Podila verticillata]|nr:hypothetical protein BGZ59_005002 [Podila verticillata]